MPMEPSFPAHLPELASLRSWVEVDLAAIQQNLAAIRAQVGNGVAVMAVVKANAYGHGLSEVVKVLADRVEMFGVANLSEAKSVAQHAPGAAVFLLGPVLPAERAEVVGAGFIPSISTLEEAAAFAALAGSRRVRVHLVIDSGMGRIGVWQDDAAELVREMLPLPGVEITGVASHLPVADDDPDFTAAQLARFGQLTAELRALGLKNAVFHIENSGGLFNFPSQAADMIRPGLALYGVAPQPEFQSQLHPALTWKTHITLVRELGPGRGVSYGRTFITAQPTRVATLGVGYADGYPRHLSGQGAEVLVGGRRCPVLGRVTMDQIMVDVTALPTVIAGDEVVLLGRQGTEEISANELATRAGSIAWEVLSRIGQRVVRVYRSDGSA